MRIGVSTRLEVSKPKPKWVFDQFNVYSAKYYEKPMGDILIPVSYTHLTLPTTERV